MISNINQLKAFSESKNIEKSNKKKRSAFYESIGLNILKKSMNNELNELEIKSFIRRSNSGEGFNMDSVREGLEKVGKTILELWDKFMDWCRSVISGIIFLKPKIKKFMEEVKNFIKTNEVESVTIDSKWSDGSLIDAMMEAVGKSRNKFKELTDSILKKDIDKMTTDSEDQDTKKSIVEKLNEINKMISNEKDITLELSPAEDMTVNQYLEDEVSFTLSIFVNDSKGGLIKMLEELSPNMNTTRRELIKFMKHEKIDEELMGKLKKRMTDLIDGSQKLFPLVARAAKYILNNYKSDFDKIVAACKESKLGK